MKTRKASNRKQVSFSPSTTVIDIPLITDPATKHRLYYSQWEYLVIQIEAERTATKAVSFLRNKEQKPQKRQQIPCSSHELRKHNVASEAHNERTMQSVQNTYSARKSIESKHVIAPPA
mmetsp:Transcript_16193/g.24452  ORF Transcript_16193/g.24452 Transcript_16193/m.24452 type:complete len:119 (-) Transcript_16193:232-588(-)